MDYFDSFDCQFQCEEYHGYGGYYPDWYGDDYCCTSGSYFESPWNYPSQDDDYEMLFDEV